MQGYYDPAPRFFLERPIAVLGCLGSDLHSVCAWMAQLSGIRLDAIARRVEHTAGCDRAHIVAREGLDGLRRRQAEALRRAAKARPPGIIAVGPAYRSRHFNAAHLGHATRTVFLIRSLDFVLSQTRTRLSQHPHDALGVHDERDPDAEAIETHWRWMSREAERAAVQVDLGALRGHAAASAVMRALDWS